MRTYSAHGFRRFVLCTGYRSDVVKSYFLNYSSMNSDFTVDLKRNDVMIHSVDNDDDWQVTVAYTGEETMTGGRIARAAAKYLGNAEHFAVTYGDGLTNADLKGELDFHVTHGSIGTVLFLINCTGLYCDRVSRIAGNRDPAKIVPFRGEYYKIRAERQYLVKNLIYPVPDPKFPFLGAHFTRLIHGGVEAGPNAVLAFSREGYRKTDFSLRDTIETLTYRGFWRFFLRYPSMCVEELKRSFSKELFCRSLQRLVPVLKVEDLAPGGAGVRAQAMAPAGDLLQDFYFVRQAGALHVLNAPSPGATASLAIADAILEDAKEALAG